MIKVIGITSNNLWYCQEIISWSNLDLIQKIYGGENGKLQVEWNIKTPIRYKIRHAEILLHIFKILFSEGIGFPSIAV